MVQGVPGDCFGLSVLFVNDFPFFRRSVLVLDLIFLFLRCDTPVDLKIGLGQENGNDNPVLVSPLMSPI